MAALLYAGTGGMITGATAVGLWGIQAPRSTMIDVLIPAMRQRRSTGFVRIHLVTPEVLAAGLRAAPVQGSALLRTAVSEVCGGIRSSPEADLKHLLRRAKIAEPMFNPRLYADEEFIASPDAWWPEAGVAGEVDSRAYHLSPQDHERTLARDARMAAQGITVLLFTPRQIRIQPGGFMPSERREAEAPRTRARAAKLRRAKLRAAKLRRAKLRRA
jgi:hypothetical protein